MAVSTLIGVGSGEVFPTSWARPIGFVGWVWLASWLYLIPGLLVIGLFAGIGRLRARHTDTTTEVDPAKRRTLQLATAAVTLAAIGTAGYGVYEASGPKISRVRVPLARLPEGFNGYRIALITDLHVGPARGVDFTRKVVDIVNSQNVDLIAIGGDLVDGTVAKVAPDLAPLANLRAPDGIFGVSGNHEFYADDGGKWLDVWETLGITTLRNSRTSIQHGGDTIDVVGIHDYTSPAPYEPNLTAALAGRDPNTFALLLAHEPRQAIEASEMGIDLQLSGAHSRRSDVAAEVSRSAAAAFGARLGQGRKHSAVHDAWRRGLGSAGTRRRPAGDHCSRTRTREVVISGGHTP